MKYIRTPIGIYEFPKGFTTFVWKNKTYLENKNHEVLSFWGNIIAQADTIEELIECYVVILEHQDRPLIVFKNEIDHYKHCLVDKIKSNNRVLAIYGSIWVDGNLIKVAKMKNKGDLKSL